jgi:hypothetical protein
VLGRWDRRVGDPDRRHGGTGAGKVTHGRHNEDRRCAIPPLPVGGPYRRGSLLSPRR